MDTEHYSIINLNQSMHIHLRRIQDFEKYKDFFYILLLNI
jgi:hypothetical protein